MRAFLGDYHRTGRSYLILRRDLELVVKHELVFHVDDFQLEDMGEAVGLDEKILVLLEASLLDHEPPQLLHLLLQLYLRDLYSLLHLLDFLGKKRVLVHLLNILVREFVSALLDDPFDLILEVSAEL